MNLIWSKPLISDDLWMPRFRGVFYRDDSGVSFFYQDGNSIRCMVESCDSPMLFMPAHNGLPLPRYWKIIRNNDHDYLMCGEFFCVDLMTGACIDHITNTLMEAYRKCCCTPKHYEDDPFEFGEFLIEHKGNWGYSCSKNGRPLWTFTGRGYLFTEIYKWEQSIFFGTAGQGGYFYILDLNDGHPIASLNTGGTTVIKQCGKYCYLFGRREKTQLLCIDLENGQICDNIALPGAVSDDSTLEIIGEKIHAITFQCDKKGKLLRTLWNCIERNNVK